MRLRKMTVVGLDSTLFILGMMCCCEAAIVEVNHVLDPTDSGKYFHYNPDAAMDDFESYVGDSHTFRQYGFVRGRSGAFVDLSELTATLIPKEEDHTLWDDFLPQDLPSWYMFPHKNESTTMDIALTKLTGDCATGFPRDCQWFTLGIGVNTRKKPPYFTQTCCNDFAILQGWCNQSHYGRLILNETIFDGYHWNVSIPPSDTQTAVPVQLFQNQPTPSIPLDDTGGYLLVMEHCNPNGAIVQLEGQITWKSVYGYLPLYLYPAWLATPLLLVAYLVLMAWYAILMRIHFESHIALEKWILCSISWGVLESLFVLLDLTLYNGMGYRNKALFLLAHLSRDMKHGLTRCLYLMVSLGYGVLHPTLSDSTMFKVLFLGTMYTLASFIMDFTYEFDRQEGWSVFWYSFMTVVAFDMMFFVWIQLALCESIATCRQSNQMQKLQRFQSLSTTSIVAVYLCILLWIVVVKETIGGGLGAPRWNGMFLFSLLDIVNELIFFAILFLVAFLWRPNPNAKDYAYVMELSTDEPPDVPPIVVVDHDDNHPELELIEMPSIHYHIQQQQQQQCDDGEIPLPIEFSVAT